MYFKSIFKSKQSLYVLLFTVVTLWSTVVLLRLTYEMHYKESKSVTGQQKSILYTSLENILLTLKTTKKNHETRIALLLQTWLKYAIAQTYLITDEVDDEWQKKTGNHFVPSLCNSTHARYDLCCKTSVEFDTFINRNEKWWCHFDDDNYVNIPNLVKLLRNYNSSKPFYIGKRSRSSVSFRTNGKTHKYMFATGGAGYCISRVLAKRMEKWISNGEMSNTCKLATTTDDCAIGFVVNYTLGIPLTESQLMHSKPGYMMEQIMLHPEELPYQVSFHYGLNRGLYANNSSWPTFKKSEDPTGFYSLHCMLQPEDGICKKLKLR